RAAASATSSPTLMKLFSLRSRRAIRSRHRRVSSTEETCLAASARESSPSVALSTLLDHFRHEVEALFDRRGDRLIKRALIDLARLVGPQPLCRIDGVRHRLDAARVDRAH